jgi:hypothetical protein
VRLLRHVIGIYNKVMTWLPRKQAEDERRSRALKYGTGDKCCVMTEDTDM